MAPLEENCERFVVIRYYKPGDEAQCRQLVYYGTMSTVMPAFYSALHKEITLQLVVVITAIMFVFLGFSPFSCLLSFPATVLLLYISIYTAHFIKAQTMTQDILNIPQHYMSSDYSGFWVAEAFEAPGAKLARCKPILIVNEGAMEHVQRRYTRCIVGTAAIIRSSTEATSAWMRRVAVDPGWQHLGIASALIDELIYFCHDKGYEMVTLVTTECHTGARALYERKGFNLRQLYHKQIFFSIVQVLMYEFTFTLDRMRDIA